jgi:hypothetical protein
VERGLRNAMCRTEVHIPSRLLRLVKPLPQSDSWTGIPRGRDPASGEGNNSSFRRAVCEQHKYGSVGGARGNPGCLPDRRKGGRTPKLPKHRTGLKFRSRCRKVSFPGATPFFSGLSGFYCFWALTSTLSFSNTTDRMRD